MTSSYLLNILLDLLGSCLTSASSGTALQHYQEHMRDRGGLNAMLELVDRGDPAKTTTIELHTKMMALHVLREAVRGCEKTIIFLNEFRSYKEISNVLLCSTQSVARIDGDQDNGGDQDDGSDARDDASSGTKSGTGLGARRKGSGLDENWCLDWCDNNDWFLVTGDAFGARDKETNKHREGRWFVQSGQESEQESERIGLVQDMVRKVLVFEVSQLSNLQYDIDKIS